MNAFEVRVQLDTISSVWSMDNVLTYEISHQASRCKVTLEEMDEISLRKKDPTTKDDDRRGKPDGIVEGVETDCGKHKASDIRQVRQCEDCERYACFASIPLRSGDAGFPWSLGRYLVGAGRALYGVLFHVRIVHCT